MNKLYFGDNLHILRDHIPSESVDLIYLDPPFNSKRDYSVLFKTPKGHESDAQITAFEDSWHWGEQAEREFDELQHQANTDVAQMIIALHGFLGKNDMMAYLTMMANRLLELHRVLKPTGSLYLHCDPTASHYLKIILDGVFGKENFINEIVWKRTNVHSHAAQGTTQFSRIQDYLLLYGKSDKRVWNQLYLPYTAEHIENSYKHVEPETGRRYSLGDLTVTDGGPKGNPRFEFMGVTRYWRYNKEKMTRLLAENKLVQTSPGAVPRQKRYLDESKGVEVSSVWLDINPIQAQAKERLGYATQKPVALLERVILASSNEGDIVLDPFCGCGTAVYAAQKLNRQWIGIDITHLAITLIEKRMKDAFGIKIEVEGTPKDVGGARDLAERDKYQFQWWACSLVNAQPYQGKKKGADGGIDGLIFFHDDKSGAKKIVVSVKGGENVSVPMIRDLAHVIDREKASFGFFVTLASPTSKMKEEAIGLGYYKSDVYGPEYPKLQILTIEGLMSGVERPRFPDLTLGRSTFKRAAVEDGGGEQGKLL